MRPLLLALLLAGCASPRPLGELLRFARAQDGAGISSVTALLSDGDPVERAHAAFALGQLGVAWDAVDEGLRASAEQALLAQAARESEAEVRDRVVEALGKLGGAASVALLTRALDGGERARAAVALGLLFKSGRLKDPVAVPRLIALLDDGDAETRWAAVYALFRMKASQARAALVARLGDGSWLVRATAARALGELGAPGEALVALMQDPDERVAAEAGRALAKGAAACAPDGDCPALAFLGSSGGWRPAVVAAVAVEPITHPAAAALFAARAGNDCLLALAHDRALGRVDLVAHCDGDERRRGVLAARALGEARPEDAGRRQLLTTLLERKEAAVRAQAAESLGKLASHASDERLAQRLADENDPAALAAIAEAVTAHRISGIELTVMRRLGALANAHDADAVEAVAALSNAAGTLGVRESVPILLRLARDPVAAVRSAAASALSSLGQPPPPRLPVKLELATPLPEARVRLDTARGPIVLRLWGKDAPRTAANFLKLVRARFYDRLSFHRVVPDFVAQGGDPRGDGSGGPGWLIACELNQRRYHEGTVGMALSGRDTGGSQFFIALSPQPHLDGRYTAFGEVIEGMAAARALVEGDRILSITEVK